MKKIFNHVLPLFFLIALILAACASVAPAASLDGTSWKLVSYGSSASQTPAVADKDASLLFNTTTGTMSGNAGCNGFSGDYKAADGQLTTGKMMSTLMACAEPFMQQESAVLSTLNGMLKYEVEKDILRIYSADGQSLLIFARQ